MRRKELEITDRREIDAILQRAIVCRLGLSDGEGPYVVPLAFGWEGGVLYFHSAREGRKMDMIRADPRVCFEVDVEVEPVTAGAPCEWSMKYRSVIGFGRARLVEGEGEKRRAVEAIAAHYSAGARPALPEDRLDAVAVVRVDIESISGRTTYR